MFRWLYSWHIPHRWQPVRLGCFTYLSCVETFRFVLALSGTVWRSVLTHEAVVFNQLDFFIFYFFLIKHFTTIHLISVCFNRLISDSSSSSSLLLSVSFTFFSQNKMAPNSIHWFRKGLRLHDNPALREAIRGAGTVRCVYFLDPWFAGSSNVGVNRWR